MVVSLKWGWATRQFCKLVLSSAIISIILLIEIMLHGEPAVIPMKKTSRTESGQIPKSMLIPDHVEIYNQASVGEYLWNHVIEGKKELQFDGVTKLGNKSMSGLSFSYISGYLHVRPIISTASITVLIIDGSTRSKQSEAEKWLNSLTLPQIPGILLLVIQGNPDCGKNQWITNYISSNGGPAHAIFITRDSIITDNKQVFSWPLGVATHLEFPLFFPDEIDILSERPYVCNFVGTIQENTTRQVIPILFEMLKLETVCYLKTRNASTTGVDQQSEYIQTLSDSDLTLCPSNEFGNSETHCIYEALSLGSIPVVEDIPSLCGSNPLNLLKKHNAPLIFVQSLQHELNSVIGNEKRLNLQEKIARRATAVNWYSDFRHQMAEQFIRVIKSHNTQTPR